MINCSISFIRNFRIFKRVFVYYRKIKLIFTTNLFILFVFYFKCDHSNFEKFATWILLLYGLKIDFIDSMEKNAQIFCALSDLGLRVSCCFFKTFCPFNSLLQDMEGNIHCCSCNDWGWILKHSILDERELNQVSGKVKCNLVSMS